MKLNITLLLSLSLILPNYILSQTWEQSVDFPGVERDDAAAFVINNDVYCGTGITTGWQSLTDFYRFNLADQSWQSTASLPHGEERQYACGLSHDSKGYIFGGYNGEYLNSFFQYSPDTDQWIELPPLPASGRSGSSCFVINDTAYIAGGRNGSEIALSEVWAYHIHQQAWVQKNDLPFGKRWKASAISYNNQGYFGFGRDDNEVMHSDFYRYDVAGDSWISLTDLPGSERCYAQLTVFEAEIVLLFGVDSSISTLNDVWSYNITNNTWTQMPTFPDVPRKGGMAFASQHSIYYTTGITSDASRLRETWRILMNDLSLDTKHIEGILYPNPASEDLHVPICEGKIKLIDPYGKTVLETSGQSLLNISRFSDGIYTVICEEGWKARIVIQKN